MSENLAATADHPADLAPHGVVVVASYSEKADAIGEQTTEAARRVLMSPTLGDLIDVSYLNLGARISNANSESGPLLRLAECLHARVAGETDPATATSLSTLLVDTSRQTVRQMLKTYAQDPQMAALRVQFSGAATVDDETQSPEDSASPRAIVTLPATGLRDGAVTRLVVQLAKSLLADIAAGHRRGVTAAELSGIAPTPNAAVAAAPTADRPGSYPAPSIELPVPVTAIAPPTGSHSVKYGSAATRSNASDHPGPESALAPVAVTARTVAAPSSSPPADRQPAAATSNVIYLLTHLDGAPSAAPWRRAKRFLADLTETLRDGGVGDQLCIRVMPTTDGSEMSPALPLSQIKKGTLARDRGNVDFADQLSAVSTTIDRDGRRAAPAGNRPTARVVIHTSVAPLADAVTVHRYQQLCHLATVVWVVKESELTMLSPQFAGLGTVLADNTEVAGEVTALLLGAPAGIQPAEEPL